jgi:ABC-type glycerol-3-phosphate transport system substrate-binding protein
MDDTRRKLIARLAAGLALAPALGASTAWAALPTVEIIAFAHPPVEAALKPLREWLAAQGNRVRVVEIDMDSPAGEKRLQALGLKGHVPIVVLVNGQYRVTRKDGSSAELVSFPSGKPPPGTTRGWSVEDAQAAIKALMT